MRSALRERNHSAGMGGGLRRHDAGIQLASLDGDVDASARSLSDFRIFGDDEAGPPCAITSEKEHRHSARVVLLASDMNKLPRMRALCQLAALQYTEQFSRL